MKTRHLCFPALLLMIFASSLGCASGQVKKSFNERSNEIAAKIAEAERLGARDCSPRELARAKVELERVRHEVLEPQYPRNWMHAEFDKADKAVDELLEKRRLAASLGSHIRCFHSGG